MGDLIMTFPNTKSISILFRSVVYCFLVFSFLQPTKSVFAAIESLDGVAAIVNNGVISESELDKEVDAISKRITATQHVSPPRAELSRQVLEKLINEKIQLQLAHETGIQVDDTMVSQAIEDIANRNRITIPQLREQLAHEGISYLEFRKNLNKEITLSRLQQRDVANQIPVSQQEIEYFLKSPEGQDLLGQEYLLGHIMIALPEAPSATDVEKAKQRVDAILKRLNNGEDFAKVAIETSQSPQALSGGNLGWRKVAQIPTIFVEATTKLKKNDIAGPLRSPSGFHIIKLLDKRAGVEGAEKISQTKVQHILIKTDATHSNEDAEMQLQHLRDLVIQGESFEKLAKLHSQDIASSQQGGDLGWVSPDVLVPEFNEVISKLSEGQISTPFKTSFGWHLAKVLGRRDETNTQVILHNKAKNLIHHRKFEEKLEAWQRQLREEAYVKVLIGSN